MFTQRADVYIYVYSVFTCVFTLLSLCLHCVVLFFYARILCVSIYGMFHYVGFFLLRANCIYSVYILRALSTLCCVFYILCVLPTCVSIYSVYINAINCCHCVVCFILFYMFYSVGYSFARNLFVYNCMCYLYVVFN